MKVSVGLWDLLEFGRRHWQVVAEADGELFLRALDGSGVKRILRADLLAAADYIANVPHVGLDRVDAISMLSAAEQDRIALLRHHLVEVLTGIPPGSPAALQPRPAYGLNLTLESKVATKAAELGAAGTPMSVRQLWRYLTRYQAEGVNGLIDGRKARTGSATGRVDLRLVGLVEEVLTEQKSVSTGTRTRAINRAAVAAAEVGLPVPSRATMFRVLHTLDRQRHSFGNATTRRTQANRPDRTYRRQAPARPGELCEIDSTPLDLLVVYPDGETGRVDLTVLLDVATRTICSAVLSPIATKAVDAALLLARAMTPATVQPGWADGVGFSRALLGVDPVS